MRAVSFPDCRLFRHDRSIVVNQVRANLTGWRDYLVAGAVVAFGAALLRSWFGDLSWHSALIAAAIAGAGAGFGTGRLLAARIAFHRADGVLAADALRPSERRRYAITWHSIAGVLFGSVMLIVQPRIAGIAVLAYPVGAGVAVLLARFATERGDASGSALMRALRRSVQRPAAGLAAAAILAASLPLTAPLPMTGRVAVVAIVAALLGLSLSPVDDAVVRFRAIGGDPPWRIFAAGASGLALFAALAVPIVWLATGPIAAGMIAAVLLAVALLLAIRVLAYAVHDKRFADFVVAVLVGLLGFVGYSMPFLLPLVAGAIVWRLYRRASARSWLLP